MSLYRYSPTRRQGYRLWLPAKGRKKKVYFPLYLLSLYTIINSMKGRICYASKKRSPGFEKLHDISNVKSSFLRPVTSRPTARRPFSLPCQVGSAPTGLPPSRIAGPACGSLLSLLFLQLGCARAAFSCHATLADHRASNTAGAPL